LLQEKVVERLLILLVFAADFRPATISNFGFCTLPFLLNRSGCIRLDNFDEAAAALGVVFWEPPVLWSGGHVSCPLHHAVKGRPPWAHLPVTEPDVFARLIYFVHELMVHAEPQTRHFIHLQHLLDEVWTVAISAYIAIVSIFRQEKPCVDEFVKQCFLQLVCRSVL